VDISSQYATIEPDDVVAEFTMTVNEFEEKWE
jgi:hypothetical protein